MRTQELIRFKVERSRCRLLGHLFFPTATPDLDQRSQMNQRAFLFDPAKTQARLQGLARPGAQFASSPGIKPQIISQPHLALITGPFYLTGPNF